MKFKLHTIPLVILLILLSNMVFSQTLRAYEKKAEEAFSKRDYPGALAYYQLLIEIDSQRVDAKFYAGESARMVRAYGVAEKHLEAIPDSAKVGFFSTTDFRIANVKKGLEKYDEAIVYYEQYLATQQSADSLFITKAKSELDYCEWALQIINDAQEMEVKQLDTTSINTYCVDFAPVLYKGVLYYSSGNDCGEIEEPSAKIFSSWGNDKNRIQEINFDPKVDSLRHVSNLNFSADGKRAFFTLCQDDPDYVGEYRCEIYFVKIDDQGNIASTPQKLPPNINKAGYTTTQPAIGVDEETGKEVLFFVSDRPEGKGNLDIWAAPIAQGDMFFKAYNLEAINTPDDDVTPFYHKESKTLFFSSDGRRSLGGLDIFKTNFENGSWTKPANLSYPINSSYDDLYYTFNSKNKKIYLASNREGSLCEDPEKGCTCTDIYESDITVNLVVSTFNAIDSTILDSVLVQLIDNETGRVVLSKLSDKDGNVTFDLDLEKDYTIVSTRNQYESDSGTISTKGLNSNKTLTKDQFLKPKIYLIAKTFDAVSKEPLNGTTVQLFDLTTAKDTVVFLPLFSNECRFELDFFKDYKISAAKNGFLSAKDTLHTYRYRKPTVLKEDLYLTPFRLPITLYFDNDKPRYIFKSDTTTHLTYEQTYEAYLDRRLTFEKEFTGILVGNAKKIKQKELNTFFEKEVVHGWNELETFCSILVPYLESGNSIAVIVEGYASPLAEEDYNDRLTGRRVSSVINQLRIFQDGILAPYLDSGKLILREEPKGEKTAKKTVSDSIKDRRSSVYSPDASRERRVRIIDVRKQENTLSWFEIDSTTPFKIDSNTPFEWTALKSILTSAK